MDSTYVNILVFFILSNAGDFSEAFGVSLLLFYSFLLFVFVLISFGMQSKLKSELVPIFTILGFSSNTLENTMSNLIT